jgi:hypothetical protein
MGGRLTGSSPLTSFQLPSVLFDRSSPAGLSPVALARSSQTACGRLGRSPLSLRRRVRGRQRARRCARPACRPAGPLPARRRLFSPDPTGRARGQASQTARGRRSRRRLSLRRRSGRRQRASPGASPGASPVRRQVRRRSVALEPGRVCDRARPRHRFKLHRRLVAGVRIVGCIASAIGETSAGEARCKRARAVSNSHHRRPLAMHWRSPVSLRGAGRQRPLAGARKERKGVGWGLSAEILHCIRRTVTDKIGDINYQRGSYTFPDQIVRTA